EESNALVRVAARFPGDISESMLPATRVAITEGLEADYLAGLGILDPGRDEATYEHKHVHTDVLVVGAGPAGLAAAREAGRTGARTLLLDDQPLPGGSLLSAGPATSATIDGRDDIDWIEATVAGFAEAEEQLRAEHHGLRQLRLELLRRPRRPHRGRRGRRRQGNPAAGVAHPRRTGGAGHRSPRPSDRVREQRPSGHHARFGRAHLTRPVRRRRR